MTEFIAQGRIVWGHPGKAQIKKDARTKAPKLDKEGKQVQQWVFGLAIPKQNFFAQCLPFMQQEAATAFPHGVPQNFSWKYKDGDGIDGAGKRYGDREGYAGHCVLTISTEAFAPQLFKFENGVYRQLAPEEMKCGDYVAVKINCKFNGAQSPNTPGLYINPNGIVHIGYGPEIVSSGQDPEEMFAGYQFTLPAGASATPLMPTAPMPGAMMPQTAPAPQYGAPQGYPPAPAQPAYAPAPVQQAYGVPGQAPAPQGYPPNGMPGIPQGR